MASDEKISADRWPPQIKYIVGNEACERFSYYGMTSILAGYISGKISEGGLGKTEDTATVIIHIFKFANYFMPLFGAWLSDKILGRYRTILWVSLFYCAGHGVLACSDLAGGPDGRLLYLYVGLALIAFGSGGIKPCVSAFMGDQFRPEQNHLLQKAYGAFYWSINFGSFFSFLIIPWIKDHRGYSPAFAVPGILMAVATVVFWMGRNKYTRIPPSHQTHTAGFFSVFLAAFRNQPGVAIAPLLHIFTTLGMPLLATIAMSVLSFSSTMTPAVRAIGWVGLSCVGLWYLFVLSGSLLGKTDLPDRFWQAAKARFSEHEIDSARSLNPIFFVFAFIPVFWCLFDQTNSTWVLQGERMVPSELFGLKIGAEQMQSANALIVMILVPLFTLLIYPRMGRLASPLHRMAYGMFLGAFSYVIVAGIQQRVDAGAHLSVLWQTVPYIILTAAEVLISTTGLEFAFREAAPELKSTIMSFWLLTVALGNLIVSTITKLFSSGQHAESVTAGRFMLYAGLTFVVAVLFSIVATRYRYRDRAAAEGK